MLTHFFNMGGYALYVWLSYGAFFIVFLANILFAYQKKQQVLRQLFKSRIKRDGV